MLRETEVSTEKTLLKYRINSRTTNTKKPMQTNKPKAKATTFTT
jgi:hypothetical protein